LYAVNGVHPNPSLTCCYPKSLVKVKMADSSIAQKWSFTAATLGHDIDMEGLTCGPDGCADYIYIGDEYNYIYKLKLGTSDPATAVEVQWDINSVVGSVRADKGIESLTYAATTGYFYAGIQETGKVHILQLDTSSGGAASTTEMSTGSGSSTTKQIDSGNPTTAVSAGVTSSTVSKLTLPSLLTWLTAMAGSCSM